VSHEGRLGIMNNQNLIRYSEDSVCDLAQLSGASCRVIQVLTNAVTYKRRFRCNFLPSQARMVFQNSLELSYKNSDLPTS